MSGPLTPPPSSSIELMDQEKDIAAPIVASGDIAVDPEPTAAAPADTPAPVPAPTDIQATSAAPTSEGPDFYQTQLTTLADFVAMGNWAELVRVGELADLHTVGDARPTRLALITPLVLAYLILDELPPAKAVLTRLPDPLATNPLTQDLFHLLSAVWARDYARVYARVEALHGATKQSSFPDAQLATVVIAQLNAFLEAFRHRALVLVSKAYSSIPLPLAQTYFGLTSGEQVVAELTKRGWTFDPSTQILSHVPTTKVPIVKSTLASSSSLAMFSFVTDAVARLEA